MRPASADFELWLVSGDPSVEGEDLKVDWEYFPVESIEMSVPVFTRQMADIRGINPVSSMQPETGSGEQVLVDLRHKRAAYLGNDDPLLEWSRDLAQVLHQAAHRYTSKGCTFALPEWLADGGEVECASWSGVTKVG